MFEKIALLKDLLTSSPTAQGLMQSLSSARSLPRAAAPAAAADETAQLEATLGLAYVVAGADGGIDDVEYDMFKQLLQGVMSPPPSDEELDGMFDRFDQALESKGFEGCLQEAASVLGPAERRGALEVAAGLSVINGEVTEDEEAVFFEVAAKIGVSEQEAEAILSRAAEQFDEGAEEEAVA